MSEEFYELYSRRHRNSDEEPDVYEYDDFPLEFRVQVFHILNRYFFGDGDSEEWQEYEELRNNLASEFGRLSLTDKEHWFLDFRKFYCESSNLDNLLSFSHLATEDEILDSIDFVFHFLWLHRSEETNVPQAVSELNRRFKQHALGYEFVNGQIIRKDTELTHEKIVKPALHFLSDPLFATAEKELLAAFSHYLKDENSDAVLDACRAFESTMKIICDKKKISYRSEKDSASDLLRNLRESGFFPTYLEAHLNALITVLQSGLPTLRNRTSGHGGGVNPLPIDASYAEYALNLACSNIIFLVRQYQASPEPKACSGGPT